MAYHVSAPRCLPLPVHTLLPALPLFSLFVMVLTKNRRWEGGGRRRSFKRRHFHGHCVSDDGCPRRRLRLGQRHRAGMAWRRFGIARSYWSVRGARGASNGFERKLRAVFWMDTWSWLGVLCILGGLLLTTLLLIPRFGYGREAFGRAQGIWQRYRFLHGWQRFRRHLEKCT